MNQPNDHDANPRIAPSAPDDPFIRFGARMLDPVASVPRSDGRAPSPTAYRADTLIVSADTRAAALAVLDRLAETATAHSPSLVVAGPSPFEEIPGAPDSDHSRRARMLQRAAELELPLAFPVRLTLNPDAAAAAVDVWPLLVSYRTAGGDPDELGLDHLMFSAANIGGTPFMSGAAAILGSPFMSGAAAVEGSPFMSGAGTGVYGYLRAGSGGRGPVTVVAQPPVGAGAFEPHAVVLDTGVDDTHPWLGPPTVRIGMQFWSPNNPNNPIGMDTADPAVDRTNPDGAGAVPDPMTGLLASHAGHGTFVTGLLRQACPDALISVVRLMDGDGSVPETVLIDALRGLAIVQADALSQSHGAEAIDAIVLSLGYYAETDDGTYSASLIKILVALSHRKVAVFCAAGNDTTTRRFYPAAFSDDPIFQTPSQVPLAAVAALNPDKSVALFSNEGPWVNAEAPGVNLVSTAPVNPSMRGGWTPDTWLVGPNSTRRATLDPDSFPTGFATWSGTSFAAPVLAGEYLAALVSRELPQTVGERGALVPIRRSHIAAATVDTQANG